MSKEDAKINCAIFQKQEVVIKDITGKINAIEGVTGKGGICRRVTKRSGCAVFLPGL